MRTKSEDVPAITGVVVAACAAIAPHLVIPAFGDVFAAFGTSLPALTRLFLHWHGLLWLFPLGVAALGFSRPGRGWLAFGIGVGGGVLLIGLLLISMYLPLFHIADTAG